VLLKAAAVLQATWLHPAGKEQMSLPQGAFITRAAHLPKLRRFTSAVLDYRSEP